MDAVRSTIVARVAELGLSLSELSLKVGKNHAYFQQFIKRGVPHRLPEDVRGRAAEILGLDERVLKDVPTGRYVAFLRDALVEPPTPPRPVAWIPVYGQAVGGKDGEFVLKGNQVSEVLAPPNLLHVPDAYAVYVVGDSMEPRYFAGETVFVNPRLPVRRGDFVVAQIAAEEGEPPHAYIKRFMAREARSLKLEQFNPRKALEFPMSRVVSVHRIIMGGDG